MTATATLIALGNRLMTDDAVALHVAERLESRLGEAGLKVVIAETDLSCAIHEIANRAILLDAALSGREVGTVWRVPKGEWCGQRSLGLSQHGFSLVEWIRLVEAREVDLIGIEVVDIGLGLGLSIEVERKLESIMAAVEWSIMSVLQQ